MVRHMYLDAFWARARSTVEKNPRRITQTIQFSELLGLAGPFDHTGSYKLTDRCGYEVAAAILIELRKPGQHDKKYTQYETIRK